MPAKESGGLWAAVGDVVTLQSVADAVRAKNPEWQVCDLVNKAVYTTLDFYGIERDDD